MIDPSLPFGDHFAAVHIIEFYRHDLRISDHDPIAASLKMGELRTQRDHCEILDAE
jgi:hypothetical protein